ncbi:hypothetical protein EMMF5_003171 [Cystobasidiomycetes sp. EMM_F5]
MLNVRKQKQMQAEEPEDVEYNRFNGYQREIYATMKPTPIPLDHIKLERAARRKLPKPNFNYVAGSAGAEKTARANRDAFDDWSIVPSMLRDANKRCLQVDLFGQRHSAPIILAPVGVQSIMHRDAEIATAKAAADVGLGMCLSTFASRSLEKVAEANSDGLRWMQLYWPITKEVTQSLLSRAKAAGYTALVVTCDTFSIGFRPRDLEEAYLPFFQGEGLQNLFTDPVFMAREGHDHTSTKWNGPGELPPGVEVGWRDEDERDVIQQTSMAALAETNSGHFFQWKDVESLRSMWDGPLVLKGIQSVADAEKAVDIGVDGIVVSNHGGRQVDGAIGSLRALENISASAKVKSSQMTIIFDSGIRTGADVIKALALGAHAVFLGRPYMWGLALGGQEGVEQVLRSILAEMEVNMALAGLTSVTDIQKRFSTSGIVVGPDYAKAPEKYFPYALRQSHSLLAWIATPAGHGESLQNSIRMSRPTEPFIAFDTSRIGLSGGSAGGNIAIALALLVQEVPIPWPLRITAIGLQYPGLDLAQSYEDKLAVTNSAEIMPPPWMSRTFLRCYLPGPLSTDEARSSPYISPNRASDAQLAQLPPLQLVTAQHDHFRQAFAVRLTSLGVTTAIEDLAGVAHAFDLARTSDATRSAINERARQTSYTLLENHFRQNL